ncbi:hypothetical protein Q8G71_36595, partial [Klebsiella pneumoniae]
AGIDQADFDLGPCGLDLGGAEETGLAGGAATELGHRAEDQRVDADQVGLLQDGLLGLDPVQVLALEHQEAVGRHQPVGQHV